MNVIVNAIMIDSFSKIYGCLIGLAIGDALGSATEGMSLSEIKTKYSKIDNFVSKDVAGTDDTEYTILTAKILLENNGKLDYQKVANGWLQYLGKEKDFRRGGISEIEAIKNLKKGIRPPKSGLIGSANWSDGAAMRIAPIGIYCAGNPEKAAKLSEIDASVSHAKDGIYCAQALAASISQAFVSNSVEIVIKTGINFLPISSDSYKIIQKMLRISKKYNSPFEAIDDLYELKTQHMWYAPEALGYAYAMLKLGKGNFKESVLGAVNLGRDADTIAAITGALCGAMNGVQCIPKKWIEKCRIVKGVCIKSFKGIDIKIIAKELEKLRSSAKGNFC
jgi:ADP-ribosylglycohydrolase